MKDKITMNALADKLEISKTTVSKALNNCAGIQPKTKQRIIDAACHYGYKVQKNANNIAVIIPCVPSYFWGEMRKSISLYAKKNSLSCNYYLFNNLKEISDAENCINQAIANNASVIITALPDSPEIKQMLETVSRNRLIILIEELLEIKNAFYIGEDPYSQGVTLAEKYIARHPDVSRFAAILSTNFITEKMKTEGFLSRLKQKGIKELTEIQINTTSKMQSAHIARQLSELKALPECIFCPSGNLSQAKLAVQKLKSPQKIDCIGFDANLNAVFCEDDISHIQNTTLQAEIAIKYAKEYIEHSAFPSDKFTYTS